MHQSPVSVTNTLVSCSKTTRFSIAKLNFGIILAGTGAAESEPISPLRRACRSPVGGAGETDG
jgi:hypothetical protein